MEARKSGSKKEDLSIGPNMLGAPGGIRTTNQLISKFKKAPSTPYIECYGVYTHPYIGVKLSKQSTVSMVW